MLYFSDGGKKVDLEYYSTDKLQYFYECNQFSFDMPQVSDDFAEINQASVSLGSDIKVKYYVHLSNSYKDSLMRFTMNGKVTEVTAEATDYENLYLFTYNGVAPHLMGESITAELVKDGTVIDTAEPFSVEDYAKKLLKMDKYELTYSAEKTEALHKLLGELLDYGAAAQEYKNYKTEKPVNEGVSCESDFDPEAIESVKKLGELHGDSGAKFTGASVRFDSAVYLRFDFNVGTSDPSAVKIIIEDKVYSLADFVQTGEGAYSVYTDAINATQLDKAYTAVLTVSDSEANTVTYSVNSYVKAMYASPAMSKLSKALYHYGEAASKLYKVISEE
jgi:hypothetical protein